MFLSKKKSLLWISLSNSFYYKIFQFINISKHSSLSVNCWEKNNREYCWNISVSVYDAQKKIDVDDVAFITLFMKSDEFWCINNNPVGITVINAVN